MTAAVSRVPMAIIGAGAVLLLLTFGQRAGIGLFLEPVSKAHGWGREVFALAVAISQLMWGVAQPFAAALAEARGTARVIVAGTLLCAASMILTPLADTPLALHLSFGVLGGLGLSAVSFGVVFGAIGRMVPDDQRSWAMGLGTAAASFGQVLMVLLSQAFLATFGWQQSLVILGLMSLGALAIAPLLRGRNPVAAGQQSLGEALREAGSHAGYWYLIAGFFVCGFHVTFLQTHLPAYLKDQGLPAQAGAWCLMLIGAANVIGSYAAGVIGQRRSKKGSLASIYLARAVVIAGFILLPTSEASAYVFSFLMGLLWLSTVPLTSGLVGQIFGPRYMGTLFAIVFLSHQVGAFCGGWLGGRLFDTTGSYSVVWWTAVVLAVLATLLHLPIDERRVQPATA